MTIEDAKAAMLAEIRKRFADVDADDLYAEFVNPNADAVAVIVFAPYAGASIAITVAGREGDRYSELMPARVENARNALLAGVTRDGLSMKRPVGRTPAVQWQHDQIPLRPA